MKRVKATVILEMTDQQAAVWNALFPAPTAERKAKARKPKVARKPVKQKSRKAWTPARLRKFRATMAAKASNGQVPEPVLTEA